MEGLAGNENRGVMIPNAVGVVELMPLRVVVRMHFRTGKAAGLTRVSKISRVPSMSWGEA